MHFNSPLDTEEVGPWKLPISEQWFLKLMVSPELRDNSGAVIGITKKQVYLTTNIKGKYIKARFSVEGAAYSDYQLKRALGFQNCGARVVDHWTHAIMMRLWFVGLLSVVGAPSCRRGKRHGWDMGLLTRAHNAKMKCAPGLQNMSK